MPLSEYSVCSECSRCPCNRRLQCRTLCGNFVCKTLRARNTPAGLGCSVHIFHEIVLLYETV